MAVTIKDVAQKANVSVATVSRVLNGTAKVSESARQAVLEAQKELGFYLNANARTLARQDSQTIGVLVSDISDPYFARMIKACDVLANSQGKSLLITQGLYDKKREKQALDNLISHQCSAIIAHVLDIPDEILKDYMERFPYIVLINKLLKGFEDRCVCIDNQSAMYNVVSYLIENGHKKIAYVQSTFSVADNQQRLLGYKQAMKAHNLEIDEKLIFKATPSLEGGVEVAKQLFKIGLDKFTAVACYSDTIAAALMNGFLNHGVKVPEDISITGFDNLFLSSCLYPALTTVINPVDVMGQQALLLSLALKNGDHSFKLGEFKTKLVCRDSVKNLNL